MGSFSQGFNSVDNADDIKKSPGKTSEALSKAGREAAASLIASGAVGPGPHTVNISGNDEGQLQVSLTVSGPHADETSADAPKS